MTDVVLETAPLGFPWVTADPFLFCVHHKDAYPEGDESMGPAVSLAGRPLGQDFEIKDGFRMYHGRVVPGFPQHPHRGFETVTIARDGYIDHSDSLGATARFGAGDVQWLTAGGGIVHAEMFPLVHRDKPNPVELFQIWMNLPSDDKMVDPHFSMLWSSEIPRITATDEAGRTVLVTLVAGELDGKRPPAPPPRSWASRPDTDILIATIRMDAGASWVLPPARLRDTHRTLYFFEGPSLKLGDHTQTSHAALAVACDRPVRLEAGPGVCEILVLQGRPIGEPVAQYGPFVMNTREEIERAMLDYRRTKFGGWPWPADDPVHPRTEGRFANTPTAESSAPTASPRV